MKQKSLETQTGFFGHEGVRSIIAGRIYYRCNVICMPYMAQNRKLLVGVSAPRGTQRRTNPAAGIGKCGVNILKGSVYFSLTV